MVGLLRIGRGIGAATRRSVTWSPSLLTLTGWYDPSDITTLFQDTAGTSPVTADGQSVARINDKSGNGRNLTQATAAARPLYRSGGYFEHDGSDDQLLSGVALSNFMTNDTYEIILAARSNTAGASGTLANNPSVLVDSAAYMVVAAHNGSGLNGLNADPSNDVATAAYTAGTNFVWAQRHTGGNLIVSLNGGADVTVASGNTSSLIGTLQLGRRGANAALSGRVYGAIISSTILSTKDRAAAKAYFAAKAGVTL